MLYISLIWVATTLDDGSEDYKIFIWKIFSGYQA